MAAAAVSHPRVNGDQAIDLTAAEQAVRGLLLRDDARSRHEFFALTALAANAASVQGEP